MSADERQHAVYPTEADTTIELGLLTRQRPIPVMPHGSTELFRALGDPSMTFEELTLTLNQFPAIVARLLAVANSPWSSPITPVLTLDGAISRLGLDVVRSASVALLVSRPFNTMRCGGFDAKRYWSSALLTAEACARIVRTMPTETAMTPAAARTAGLISNLGLLWMADAMPRETGRALRRAADDPELTTHEAMMLVCGVSYSHAGAALARTWDMPPLLGAALANKLPATPGSREHACASLIGTAGTLVSDLQTEPLNGGCGNRSEHDVPCSFQRIRDDLRRLLPEYRELATSLFRDSSTDL